MNITRVSISGADDGVDPVDLLKLSIEFPFVEWGILYSEKRQGTARYPSPEWRENLIGLLINTARHRSLHLSLHLCGKSSRDVFEGTPSRWFAKDEFHAPYERVQLNGFTPYKEELRLDVDLLKTCPSEFIVQCADEDELRRVDDFSNLHGLKFLNALFDPSGGRGIRSNTWAHPPMKSISVGYAGGIGSDNILDVIGVIRSKTTPATLSTCWIDMESRVRTEDAFDLKLVKEVLAACKSAMEQP